MDLSPFQELKAYTGFGDIDTERLRSMVPVVEPHLHGIVERFYDRILQFPSAAAVFKDTAQVNRLKGSLSKWIMEVLSGPHDDAYYRRHLMIGRRHVEVGLPQQYMFTAMNQLRLELTEICRATWDAERCHDVLVSLMRILDLELAVMLDTYVRDTKTQELEDLRNLLMQNLPISAMLLDSEGRVSAATGALRAHLGTPEPTMGTVPYQQMLDPALIEASDLPERVEEAVITGKVVELPRLDVHLDDAQRSLKLTIVPLEHPQARVLIHIEDLTETIQQEARARHADNLAQLGHMAAAIAHELRNPLAGFSATMQVLLGSLPEKDRRRAIMVKVLEQIQRLDGLVADLLQFARPVQSENSDVDLKSVARRVASQASLAEIGNTQIRGSGRAYADVALLQQAVYNLVLNAWQTGATKVEIVVSEAGLCVIDDGPGVPANKQEEIFKPFVTTRTRGTGLGLPNAQRFVEAMGGTLGLTASALGGAGFEIRLMCAQTASAGHASPSDT